MSHFVVLAAAIDEDDLQQKMMRYKEKGTGDYNLDDGIPKEVLEFNSSEEEIREDYHNDPMSVVITADNKLLSKYDDKFRRPFDPEDPLGLHVELEDRWIYPDGAIQTEIMPDQRYENVEQFATEYWGMDGRDPITGEYGHWQNKMARWDWYQIGGRWTGMLAPHYKPEDDPANQERCYLCDGTGIRPSMGYIDPFTKVKMFVDDWAKKCNGCNSCHGEGIRTKWPTQYARYSGDVITPASRIDWEALRIEARDIAVKNYRAFRAALEEVSSDNRTIFGKMEELKDRWERIDYWREQFESLEDMAVASLAAIKADMWAMDINRESQLFYMREEEIGEMAYNRAISYSFLDQDGTWWERGEMHMFGVDSPNLEYDYNELFWDKIDKMSHDQLLFVVDCHI